MTFDVADVADMTLDSFWEADGAAISNEIRGKTDTLAFLSAGLGVFNKWEHRVLASAFDANSGSSFTFWIDTVRCRQAPLFSMDWSSPRPLPLANK